MAGDALVAWAGDVLWLSTGWSVWRPSPLDFLVEDSAMVVSLGGGSSNQNYIWNILPLDVHVLFPESLWRNGTQDLWRGAGSWTDYACYLLA